MESRKVIRILEGNGWRLKEVRGSHHQFEHPDKAGKVTVTHPRKDIPVGTLRQIERRAGLRLRS